MRCLVVAASIAVVLAVSPPYLRSQAPEVTINALQVRRACLNSAADQTLKTICSLTLPRGGLSAEKDWAPWTVALKDSTYQLAENIEHFSATLPDDSLTVWDVYFALNEAQRDSAILRFGRNDGILRAALNRLPVPVKRDLLRSAVDGSSDPAVPAMPASVAREITAALARDSSDVAAAFDGAMKRFTDPERLLVLSQLGPARDTVAGEILRTRRVSVLLEGKDAKSYLSEGVRRSVGNEYASVAAQPVRATAAIQSNLVWGTTDFVVERVQQQFQAFALQGFVNRMCAGPGASTLRFSCATLRSSSFGASRPGVMLLRGALSRDLEALPYTSLEYAYAQYAARLNPSEADALQVALRVTSFTLQTARGTDPLLALVSVADSFRAAQVEPGKHARTPPTDSGFAADSSGFGGVFVGLAALYATRFDPLRMHTVEWVGSNPRDLLRYQLIAMAANYQPRVQRTGARLAFAPWKVIPVALAVNDDLQQLRVQKAQLDSLRTTRPDSSSVVRHARLALVRASFGLVDEVLFETAQLWNDPGRVTRARQVSEGVQDVIFPMMEGNYSAGLLALHGQMLAYMDNVSSLDRRDRADFTRGVTFASELADASSADQVNAALARLADSGEGFLGKRNTVRARLTLNAYGGAYGGFETAENRTSTFAGLYLPVGLEITFPGNLGRMLHRKVGTLGLFVQAVDLGALASWRLNGDDKVEQRPEVGLAQVFSPGAFAVVNISGAPLTLGYGLSWAPELRKLKEEDVTAGSAGRVTAWRHGMFIAFDIPLFP
jgi:hypothetical protein